MLFVGMDVFFSITEFVFEEVVIEEAVIFWADSVEMLKSELGIVFELVKEEEDETILEYFKNIKYKYKILKFIFFFFFSNFYF